MIIGIEPKLPEIEREPGFFKWSWGLIGTLKTILAR
jgi:hypothetical protein